MTYIAAFDPEWHAADPENDIPFACEGCGWSGTREDCERIGHSVVICPACRMLAWVGRETT